MDDRHDSGAHDRALRELAGAVRAARLYPPTSEIPTRSAAAAAESLSAICALSGGELRIGVSREGLRCEGFDGAASVAPAVAELAELLRDHGVAGVTVGSSVVAHDVTVLATALHEQPASLRAGGGIAGVLRSAGVDRLTVSDVTLSVADSPSAGASVSEEVESWLQALGSDADRLTAWLTAASALDAETLEESLLELEQAAGSLGAGLFDSALAEAFDRQSPGAKDAVLAVASESDKVRALAARMFKELPPDRIAWSIMGGGFGKNMLSLSHALTALPLGDAFEAVRQHVIEASSRSGRSAREIAFLEHMLQVRTAAADEPPLAQADAALSALNSAAAISPDEMATVRDTVVGSERAVSKAGIRAMLMLLDNQRSFRMYSETLEAVLAMVPGLIVADELILARDVLRQVSMRHETNTAPWPELTERLEGAKAAAVRPEAMKALLSGVIADHLAAGDVREIVTLLGDTAAEELGCQALSMGASGLDAAERIIGSARLVSVLCAHSQEAEGIGLEALTARLAREHDAQSVDTVSRLLHRPDVRTRRAVARGLAAVAGPARSKLLAEALRDEDREVVATVAAGVARCGVPGSAELLGSRLDELNIDGADFELARDLIGALAVTPEAAAGVILERMAKRRTLIKRGHFAEIQSAVAQALRVRTEGVG